jgi:hypothetical protein
LRTNDYLQANLRQGITTHFFSHPGGCYLRRLSCCFGGHLGFWHKAFNRHSLRDGATLYFCPYQHKTYEISSLGALTTTRGRPHYCSILTFYYAGFWQRSLRDRHHGLGLREGSGLLGGGRGNFFSRRVLGSTSSQDKSVDFLHGTRLVVNQVRLPSYKYYSGKVFTYKLDRTTVTVGAPRLLVISTSPASAGASSSA